MPSKSVARRMAVQGGFTAGELKALRAARHYLLEYEGDCSKGGYWWAPKGGAVRVAIRLQAAGLLKSESVVMECTEYRCKTCLDGREHVGVGYQPTEAGLAALEMLGGPAR